MARIVSVEALLLDLPSKVERTDAIQTFVGRGTPMVRITDHNGYSDTPSEPVSGRSLVG